MNSNFFAKPPKVLWQTPGKDLRRQLWRMLLSIPRYVLQSLVPFYPRPDAPQPLPPQTADPDEAQLAQCQWVFDQAENRRIHLEQKGQSTFTVMVFLVPLITSVLLFLFRESSPDGLGYEVAVCSLIASGTLLLLAFISVMRAISVQERETLFLGAVIDLKNGQFRKYNRSFHARGLLYCAAVNTAMNDHIAQFVKGARILTACAVLLLVAAAVAAATRFSPTPGSPVRTEIAGQINLSTASMAPLQEEIEKLRIEIAALANTANRDDRINLLEARVAALEENIDRLQKTLSSASASRTRSMKSNEHSR